MIVTLDGVDDAVAQVVLQDDFSGVVDGAADGGQLDEDLGAVDAGLDHALDLLQMSDGPGQPVDDGLLVLVHVPMRAVGCGVLVVLVMIWMVWMIGMLVVRWGAVRMLHGRAPFAENWLLLTRNSRGMAVYCYHTSKSARLQAENGKNGGINKCAYRISSYLTSPNVCGIMGPKIKKESRCREMHEHTHSHAHDHGATPQEELTALMHYMVHHNEAHAKELAGLAQQLVEAGKQPVSETVLQAVADFERGNRKLEEALAALQA